MRLQFDKSTVLIVVGIFVLVAAGTLFAINERSANNKFAISQLASSSKVKQHVGQVQNTMLVGYRAKSMNDEHCAEFNYVVSGSRTVGWVTVTLKKKGPHADPPWDIFDVSPGFFTSSQHYC